MQRRPDRMHRARHQIEHEDATFDAFFDTHYFPGEVFRFPGNRAEQFQCGCGSSTRPHQHKATTFKVLHAWCCVHIFIEGEEGGHFVGHFGTHTTSLKTSSYIDLNSMIP